MSSFIRDPNTRMVINTDDSHYQSILHARAAEKETSALRMKLEEMDAVIQDVVTMKQQLEELISGNKNVQTSS